jgi:thiamine pyrophosphokinase
MDATEAPLPEPRPRTAVVVTGGEPPDALPVHRIGPAPFVVAADSGLTTAELLGLPVDVVVGDLDSIDRARLDAARAAGVTVEPHPVAKDRTDLALALDRALDSAADLERIVVLGGHGGRLDHFLANALVLASPDYAAVDVEARFGPARLHVVRRRTVVEGARGDLLSLLPLGGPAHGVRTEGLLYPLRDESLTPGSTRGVSNEMTGAVAVVDVDDGVVLAVVPGAAGTHLDASARHHHRGGTP